MALIRDEQIGSYIDRLGQRVPAPGGGAASGLNVAQAAALLGMVARYTSGAKFADHQETVERLVEECGRLAESALRAAEDDEAAFAAVGAVYRLPNVTADERRERSLRLADAVRAAAKPPADVVDIAERLVAVAEELLPIGNKSVISDVGAASESLRAGAATARINLEVNLPGVQDEQEKSALRKQVGRVDGILSRSQRIGDQVREVIRG